MQPEVKRPCCSMKRPSPASDKHPNDAALDTSLARLADAKFDEARALRTRARLFQGAEYLIAILGLALLIVRFSGTAPTQD
jgi:hypothetical protein